MLQPGFGIMKYLFHDAQGCITEKRGTDKVMDLVCAPLRTVRDAKEY